MKPKISIIIPTKDRWEKLQNCLKAIKDNTKVSHEVIIICDGDLKTFEKLKGKKHIIAYNSVPQEYFHCINQGCMVATGDYIVYLADDVRVRLNWDKECIKAFEDNFKDGIGLVGMRSDLGEGETHAPHGLVSKKMVFMNTCLFPNVYKHYFGDTELSLRMQKIGKYITTKEIVFNHDHKSKDKKFDDHVYSESFKNCWKSDEIQFHLRNPELVAGMVLIKGDRKENWFYGQWWYK